MTVQPTDSGDDLVMDSDSGDMSTDEDVAGGKTSRQRASPSRKSVFCAKSEKPAHELLVADYDSVSSVCSDKETSLDMDSLEVEGGGACANENVTEVLQRCMPLDMEKLLPS